MSIAAESMERNLMHNERTYPVATHGGWAARTHLGTYVPAGDPHWRKEVRVSARRIATHVGNWKNNLAKDVARFNGYVAYVEDNMAGDGDPEGRSRVVRVFYAVADGALYHQTLIVRHKEAS